MEHALCESEREGISAVSADGRLSGAKSRAVASDCGPRAGSEGRGSG